MKLKKEQTPLLILIFFILLGIYLQYNILSKLESLPSPLYGGDLYYHLGMMYHLRDGGSIFENSQLLGEIPWSPFLYQYLVVLFSGIFNISLITAVIWFSIPLQIISIILFYLFAYIIFKDKWLALIPPLYAISFYPVFKYTPFTVVVVLPLFFLSYYLALSRKRKIYYLIAGISYGLIGISHTLIFIEATVFLLISYVILIFSNVFKSEKTKIKFNISKLIYNISSNFNYFIIIFCGLLISQLYWYQPIFIKHLEIPNRISDYDQVNYEQINLLNYSLNTFVTLFFNFSNLTITIVSILSILGVIYLLINQNKFENKYILWILVTIFICRFHYLITFPILHTDFFSRLMTHFIPIIRSLLLVYGFLFIFWIIKKPKIYEKRQVLVPILIITLLITISTFTQKIENDKWIRVGEAPLPNYLKNVQSYILENTDINDVFISTNEISFALNGLTGRKVLNSRRAHSGMYVDVDKRYADAAIILYGNNSNLTSKLIKKYKIKYLYWQYNWVSLDFTIDKQGNLVNLFDPLIIRNIDNYSEYLLNNGVKFKRINFWLDPANRNKDVKKYDVLLVLPYNWSNENPFSPTLREHLNLVKEFKENNRIVAKIYKVIT